MQNYLKVKDLETICRSCNEERETTICTIANEDEMKIYTSDNTMLTKLKKVMEANPLTVKCWCAGRNSNGDVTGYFFLMPKKHLSIRITAGREVSEENKKLASERFKKLRAEGKIGRKK